MSPPGNAPPAGAGAFTLVAAATLVLAALASFPLAGCADEARDRIVLWHHYNGDERQALESVARDIAERKDFDIELVAIPYENFADQITNAIPNGNGPDLFVFAHDRLGDWVEAGLVEPIEFFVDPQLAGRYAYDPLASMAYGSSLYGLPLSVKSTALFYRTDLVDEPPATTEELVAWARAGASDDGPRYALAYDTTDLYNHAAWLHGYGGSVFAEGELTVASDAASRAIEFVQRLADEGIAPRAVRSEMVATLFSEGEAAMALSGPWFIGDIADGTPWDVAMLPVVAETGERAAPFLGTEGVWMSAWSEHESEAFAVMEALAGDESAAVRAREARQIVPNTAVYDKEDIGDDPLLSTFRQQLEHAVPMPGTPAMRAVWTPYARALEASIERGGEARAALADAERTIRGHLQHESDR